MRAILKTISLVIGPIATIIWAWHTVDSEVYVAQKEIQIMEKRIQTMEDYHRLHIKLLSDSTRELRNRVDELAKDNSSNSEPDH